MSMGNEKLYEEGSLAYYASIAIKRIKKLSESGKISDKLLAYNVLLFILVVGLAITYHFKVSLNIPWPTGMDFISLGILASISFILSSIVSLGYAPVLEIVSNISGDKTKNKIEPLRMSILVLLIALNLALIGLIYGISLLVNLSLGLVGLQLIMIPISSLFPLKTTIEDKEVEANQIWEVLGKINIIIGIVSFVIQIIAIINKI